MHSTGRIIYPTRSVFSKRANNSKMQITSPILDGVGRNIGVVEVGLDANMAAIVAKTTKNSMLIVFNLVWTEDVFVMKITLSTVEQCKRS